MQEISGLAVPFCRDAFFYYLRNSRPNNIKPKRRKFANGNGRTMLHKWKGRSAIDIDGGDWWAGNKLSAVQADRV